MDNKYKIVIYLKLTSVEALVTHRCGPVFRNGQKDHFKVKEELQTMTKIIFYVFEH